MVVFILLINLWPNFVSYLRSYHLQVIALFNLIKWFESIQFYFWCWAIKLNWIKSLKTIKAFLVENINTPSCKTYFYECNLLFLLLLTHQIEIANFWTIWWIKACNRYRNDFELCTQTDSIYSHFRTRIATSELGKTTAVGSQHQWVDLQAHVRAEWYDIDINSWEDPP